jgi:hypothetical protein
MAMNSMIDITFMTMPRAGLAMVLSMDAGPDTAVPGQHQAAGQERN